MGFIGSGPLAGAIVGLGTGTLRFGGNEMRMNESTKSASWSGSSKFSQSFRLYHRETNNWSFSGVMGYLSSIWMFPK